MAGISFEESFHGREGRLQIVWFRGEAGERRVVLTENYTTGYRGATWSTARKGKSRIISVGPFEPTKRGKYAAIDVASSEEDAVVRVSTMLTGLAQDDRSREFAHAVAERGLSFWRTGENPKRR